MWGSRIKASAQKDPEDILQDVAYNLFAGCRRVRAN